MFGVLKKKYRIRVDGHRVYVKWHRSIKEWTDRECREYLSKLRLAIQKSVTPEIWAFPCEHERSTDELYQRYVEKVKVQLASEYGLGMKLNDVSTGLYHLDLLVICFIGKKGERYPYYYQGVQLKPNQPR